jgi:iron complex transport system ATP-binding protein
MKKEHALYQLKNISFSYTEKMLLNQFNLSIDENKFIGVLGPNGSGKSTLLSLLSGILTPQSGDCLIRDVPIASYQKKELAKFLTLLPQDFAIRFNFTVQEVVEMGRHPHLKRFECLSESDFILIEKVMKQLDILQFSDRPVTDLSGGEQQRVALARVLVQDPEVLLLDEFNSNLDIYHTLSILSLLQQKMDSSNLTLIAAIHDINLAAAFCDEIIFMKAGKIITQGDSRDVLKPKIISEVYGVDVDVIENPKTKRPYILFNSITTKNGAT